MDIGPGLPPQITKTPILAHRPTAHVRPSGQDQTSTYETQTLASLQFLLVGTAVNAWRHRVSMRSPKTRLTECEFRHVRHGLKNKLEILEKHQIRIRIVVYSGRFQLGRGIHSTRRGINTFFLIGRGINTTILPYWSVGKAFRSPHENSMKNALGSRDMVLVYVARGAS